MSSSTTTNSSPDVSPQQIGKAFVVQYYRLLHEHPESLHRFYSSSSTLMHDDPNKTATGIENITKRIAELSFKQRQVKIRQVDCHSTVGSAVVVQVCGEISSTPITDNQNPMMKRFVQTFVLAPTDTAKHKYYVHNDIFRYQDNSSTTSVDPKISSFTTEQQTTTSETTSNKTTPISPSVEINIEFSDNTITKQDEQPKVDTNITVSPVEEKQQSTKPKSYRDAIGKKEKTPGNENPTSASTATATTTKTTKSNKQKSTKSTNQNAKSSSRGHPQDTNDYYDDSWYYGADAEAYLGTGYVDDQEVFVGNLSAQITEQEIHELFRPYGRLLLVRIGNTGSQVGAANFAFVVCQSIDMAKTIVADRENLQTKHQVDIQAKKRRPFPHTFRPTYPTAASPTSYQSTGYPASFYERAASSAPFYGGGVAARGARRGGKGGAQ